MNVIYTTNMYILERHDNVSHRVGYHRSSLGSLLYVLYLYMFFTFILGNLHLTEKGYLRAGLMSTFSIECSKCNHKVSVETSKCVTSKGRSFDVNRRAVYHSLETGGGYEGLSTFCSIMNMPCMSKSAYYKQVEIVLECQETEAEFEMTQAGLKLRQVVLDEIGDEDDVCDSDVLDVAVSFDGTWAKRGFSSLIGVVFVISVDTGEVLDYHVLSKTCQKCALKKYNVSEQAFELWREQHVNDAECDINFIGSSQAMEAEGAVVMWKRSIAKHNIRY